MPKIVSYSHSPHVLKTTPAQHRTRRPQESTGVVLAKNPLMVKLENFFTTLECQSWGELLCVPCFLRALGFYSSAEPTSVSCVGRCFSMGKIIINARILRDSFPFGILLIGVSCGTQVISIQNSLEPTQNHVGTPWLWYPSTMYSCDLNPSISRDYPSIIGRSPSVTCHIHRMPLCCHIFAYQPSTVRST